MSGLIGVGLYTVPDAARLSGISGSKIRRWLTGHQIGSRSYARLWEPQVVLGDTIVLGFRDLIEVRVAAAFIAQGLSPQRVRRAIQIARQELKVERPLSTARFRTDGRKVFLQTIEEGSESEEREHFLDLFNSQLEWRRIVEPSLKAVDFDDNVPTAWWPIGREGKIVVDPTRAFGKPIDSVTSVPTAVLAAAAQVEGIDAAARAFDVPKASVRRAARFEQSLNQRRAA